MSQMRFAAQLFHDHDRVLIFVFRPVHISNFMPWCIRCLHYWLLSDTATVVTPDYYAFFITSSYPGSLGNGCININQTFAFHQDVRRQAIRYFSRR